MYYELAITVESGIAGSMQVAEDLAVLPQL